MTGRPHVNINIQRRERLAAHGKWCNVTVAIYNMECIGETKRRLKGRINELRRPVNKTNINLN